MAIRRKQKTICQNNEVLCQNTTNIFFIKTTFSYQMIHNKTQVEKIARNLINTLFIYTILCYASSFFVICKTIQK